MGIPANTDNRWMMNFAHHHERQLSGIEFLTLNVTNWPTTARPHHAASVRSSQDNRLWFH
jgi:hypothetical protein